MPRISLVLLIACLSCTASKQTKTIHPFTGDAVGCGQFIVYKLTESNDEYVSISFDVGSVLLQRLQSYAIDKAQVVTVKRKRFEAPIHDTLCNDVRREKPQKSFEEAAKEGIVEIYLSDIDIERAKNKESYYVTVVLKNVIFDSISIDYLRLEKIYVGWLPG